MDVRHCPKCGSSDVSKSSSSFEYGGSTRWSCSDCEWYYKQGRGIGTGTGTHGTHPRELSGGDQQTLTQTGEYCSTCETVIAGDHACTADKVLDGEPLPQQEVIDALEEWHINGHRALVEDVKAGRVDLTPTFYYVTEASDEPEMFDVLLNEIESIIDEQDSEAMSSWTDPDYAPFKSITSRLVVENDAETEFIRRCLGRMGRKNILSKGHYGWRPADG